jgi:hypothetical protein
MYAISKSVLVVGLSCLTLLFNKEISATLSDNSKVIYNMSEDKKLNGPFAITREDKVLLRGSYKDDRRSGNWYCFNPDGSVYMRYNYDQKRLVVLDTARVARAIVEFPGIKEESANGSIPVPVCSIDQYVSLLGSEFRRLILAENKNAEGVVPVELIANIDKNGKATYTGNYDAEGVTMTKRLKPVVKLFNIEWLPATMSGKPVEAVFKVNMSVDLSSNDVGRQRFRWTNY